MSSRLKFMLIAFGIPFYLQAQHLTIESGAYFRMTKNMQLRLSNMSLDVEDNKNFIADTLSTIVMAGSGQERGINGIGKPLELYSFKVAGNVGLNTDVAIKGNLTFASGVLDIKDKTVLLHGSLSGENKSSFLTSSSNGEVIKELYVTANNRNLLGNIGIEIVPEETMLLTVHRKHTPIRMGKDLTGKDFSMAKQFALSPAIDLAKVDVVYHDKEMNGITEPVLYLFSERENDWLVSSVIKTMDGRISGQGVERITGVTIFPFPSLNFPLFITPNGDGINDLFAVAGNEKNVTSRLVILTPAGKVVYDKTPYKNNFNGLTENGNLATGTYFYMYYSAKDSKPVKRGYFEIIR